MLRSLEVIAPSILPSPFSAGRTAPLLLVRLFQRGLPTLARHRQSICLLGRRQRWYARRAKRGPRQFAVQEFRGADVACGSDSDLRRCPWHVRFASDYDRNADVAALRIWAMTDIAAPSGAQLTSNVKLSAQGGNLASTRRFPALPTSCRPEHRQKAVC